MSIREPQNAAQASSVHLKLVDFLKKLAIRMNILSRRIGQNALRSARSWNPNLNRRATSYRTFTNSIRTTGTSRAFSRRTIAFAVLSAAGLSLAWQGHKEVLLDAAQPSEVRGACSE